MPATVSRKVVGRSQYFQKTCAELCPSNPDEVVDSVLVTALRWCTRDNAEIDLYSRPGSARNRTSQEMPADADRQVVFLDERISTLRIPHSPSTWLRR